eukprot:gene27235-18298_t
MAHVPRKGACARFPHHPWRHTSPQQEFHSVHASTTWWNASKQYQGAITWIAKNRNFGFITTGKGDSCFFHRSALAPQFGDVAEGKQVKFRVAQNPEDGRFRATAVWQASAKAPDH